MMPNVDDKEHYTHTHTHTQTDRQTADRLLHYTALKQSRTVSYRLCISA